jgi:hypothetical protein
MKKLFDKVRFYSILAVMALTSSSAFADESGAETAICNLLTKLAPLFKVLSILAFVGAGFIIAGWAWGFISAGKVTVDDIKGKGIGMLVGFVLLFAIGALLQFLINSTGGSGFIGTNCQGLQEMFPGFTAN